MSSFVNSRTREDQRISAKLRRCLPDPLPTLARARISAILVRFSYPFRKFIIFELGVCYSRIGFAALNYLFCANGLRCVYAASTRMVQCAGNQAGKANNLRFSGTSHLRENRTAIPALRTMSSGMG